MVRYEVQGRTAVATIDRVEVRNALDRATLRPLREPDEADPDARVLVVTGAGDQAVSAGAGEGRGDPPVRFRWREDLRPRCRRRR